MSGTPEENPYRDYWASVASIAQEAKDAEKEGNDPHDFIRESVDGSHWIIYTYANLHVLQHGRNEDAAFEEMGSEALSGYGETMQRLAYYAMMADVEAEFADLPDAETEDDAETEATP